MTEKTKKKQVHQITQRQEVFCREYIKTGNATEAYKTAYNTEDSKPSTVHRLAKRALDNPKIISRIEEMRAPAVKKAQVTLEQHLNDLKEIRDMAIADRHFGSAVSAEIARGKAAGLYVEKKDVQGTIEIVWGG